MKSPTNHQFKITNFPVSSHQNVLKFQLRLRAWNVYRNWIKQHIVGIWNTKCGHLKWAFWSVISPKKCLYNCMKHNWSILKLHFLFYQNQYKCVFCIFFRKKCEQLFIYTLFIKDMSQQEHHTKENLSIMHIPKITVFHAFFRRFIKICNSTPNPSWTIFAPYL